MSGEELQQIVMGDKLLQSILLFCIAFVMTIYFGMKNKTRNKRTNSLNKKWLTFGIGFMATAIFFAVGGDSLVSDGGFVLSGWKGIALAVIETILALWAIGFVLKRKK